MWGIFLNGQMVGDAIYTTSERAEEIRNRVQDEVDKRPYDNFPTFFYTKALRIIE